MSYVKLAAVVIGACLIGTASFAWDGTDSTTGESVEIGQGELVRSGNSIEFFDHATGQYHSADVQDINRLGSTVEVEVFDYTTGENRTLEMDD